MHVWLILFEMSSRFDLRLLLRSISHFTSVLECDIAIQMIRQSTFLEFQGYLNNSQGWTAEQLNIIRKWCRDWGLINCPIIWHLWRCHRLTYFLTVLHVRWERTGDIQATNRQPNPRWLYYTCRTIWDDRSPRVGLYCIIEGEHRTSR
jgi:hypothetical protein